MIYLDNASTTKPCEAAMDAMCEAAGQFGNPSSMHKLGIDAEKKIKTAKEIIGKVLTVPGKNLYFTSGGTEANNTAIFGTARQNKKRGTHLITTKIEHPSVLDAFRALEQEGFSVTYLDVLASGVVDLAQLEQALTENTILVSIMHVNNETGSIQPVDKIKTLLKQKAPKAYFHVDAVQSFGKIDIFPGQWGIDLLTVSAHKIHGIKGTGALYIKDGVKITPLIYGGGQQNSLRPGTENVPGIAAFGAAAAQINTQSCFEKLICLRRRLKEQLVGQVEKIKVNGEEDVSAGSVLNISFLGLRAEILLHALEARGVYVSTGSACSTHKPMPSHVLTAMGCTPKEIDGAVRFSFSKNTTEQEIDQAAEIIREEAENIRKYMR